MHPMHRYTMIKLVRVMRVRRPNDQDQRPRASDIWHGAETRSRGSLHPELGGKTHSLPPHNWNTLGRLISVRWSSVNRVNPSIADCNSDSVTNFSSSKEWAM